MLVFFFYQGLIGLLPGADWFLPGADLQVIMQLYKRGLHEGTSSLTPWSLHREDLQSTLPVGRPHCFQGDSFPVVMFH